MYISSYEMMCHHMKQPEEEHCSVPAMLLAGGLAGSLSWLVNIPIDVIKTRIQTDNLSNPRYCGILDCAIKSFQSDGIKVFWRGALVICIRAFPTNAVTFAVYSSSLRALNNAAKKKEANIQSSDLAETLSPQENIAVQVKLAV